MIFIDFILFLVISIIRYLSLQAQQATIKGVVSMKINLFLSSMLESLWSMAMSFVIGSSSSPRAHKFITRTVKTLTNHRDKDYR